MGLHATRPDWRDTCLLGLDGALARVSGVIKQGADPTIAVSESLHWIYCVYDHDRSAAGLTHAQFLPQFLSVPDRDIARALAAVRGDQVHRFMDLVDEVNLYPTENLYPSESLHPGRTWRFLDFEPTNCSQDVVELYRTKVAQQAVLVMLERARNAIA